MKTVFVHRVVLFAVGLLVGIVAVPVVSSADVPASTPATVTFGWRDMFRMYQRLGEKLPGEDWAEKFPGLSVDIAQLGESFARTAYPEDIALGRKNFSTLVRNLGMEKPAAKDLRQFLHPNKKPWPEYTGPVDGNFHMLFNTGTLNLDTSDGSSKDHPVKKLAREHLSFFTTQAHVKALTQTLSSVVRAQKVDIALAHTDSAKRAALLEAYKITWKVRFPKDSLSERDLRFIAAMLPYVA
ncbi:MAG: hypothetical protein LBV54_07930 [Puniceicoccales bacterium]|jgi:hypothetical protein|nr:hypothetical protein [Puniceicoccales bacterium]